MKIRDLLMGRFMVIVALLILVVALTGGCWGSMNEAFVKAVDSNWTVIGKEYIAYVMADQTMPESSREIRLKTAAEFSVLVQETKDKIEK